MTCRVVRTIGGRRLVCTLELPACPVAGVHLVLEGGQRVRIADVAIAPRTEPWVPGIRLPRVELRLEPEPDGDLEPAIAGGWREVAR